MKVLFLLMTAAVCIAALWAVMSAAGLVLGTNREDKGEFLVLPIAGHMEDVELRVRRAVSRGQRLRGARIILADFGADEETLGIAGRLCLEYQSAEIVPADRLAERLRDRWGIN